MNAGLSPQMVLTAGVTLSGRKQRDPPLETSGGTGTDHRRCILDGITITDY